jgi:ATPase subunit of ABC transporter with duplicated ATPase domains
VTGTLERGDFTVEKLHYQSRPGLYVTANLYRPAHVEPGTRLEVVYFDQLRAQLDESMRVQDAVADGNATVTIDGRTRHVISYLEDFLFEPSRARTPIRALSGGERNRVHMAKLLKAGGNVLLLDEPTNDLDVETLRALEDALEDFAGCAVIISHDRFFLDRLCTHILAFEGEAHVEWFEGDFSAYEEDKKRRLGPDALEPKRLKYKKFTR